MKEFIKKHSIVSYLLITFIGTWIVYLPVLLLYGKEISIEKPGVIPTSLIIGVFPSLTAFLITYIKEGRIKGSSIIQRVKKKSSGKLYLVVALIMPSYLLLHVFFSNLLVTPYQIRIQPGMIALAVFWGFCSTFGEEFGWRAFVLPSFFKKHSILLSGVLLGIIWGLWHFPMNYIGCASYGNDVALFILLPTLQLVFDSTIIAGVFVKAKGNLKATLIYHFTLTSMTILEGAIWEATNYTHTNELYTNLIGYAIKTVIIILVYASIRKQKKQEAIC